MLFFFFLLVLAAYMNDDWSGLLNSHRDLEYLKKKKKNPLKFDPSVGQTSLRLTF